jgi:hypothetical protein
MENADEGSIRHPVAEIPNMTFNDFRQIFTKRIAC